MKISAGLAQQMLEGSPLPICWVDRESRIRYCNPAFRDLLGKGAGEASVLSDFLSHQQSFGWAESWRLILAGALRQDRGLIVSAGQEQHVEVSFSVMQDGEDTLIAVVVNKVYEQAPDLDPGADFNQVIDEAAIGIMVIDRQGRIRYANRAGCRMLGYEAEELCQLGVEDVEADHTRQELRQMVRTLEDEGKDPVFISRHRRKDGSIYHAEVSIATSQARYRDFVFSIFRDVSDSLQHEKQKEQLNFLLENANDAVYIFDSEDNIIYANKLASLIMGYERQELLRMNIRDLDAFYPDPAHENYRQRTMEGERIVFETRHRTKSGETLPVEVSVAFSVYDGEVYNSAFVRDISERKKHQREMEELRFALENASDAIYLYDRKGRIHYANRSACDVLGYSKQEFTAMRLQELDPLFSEVNHQSLWSDEPRKDARPLQTLHYKKNGSSYPVEVMVSASTSGDKDFAVAFVRDISDRVQVQRALEEGEERFRIIADTSPVALIIHTLSGGSIQYANTQAGVLFGKSIDELDRFTFGDLLRQSAVEEELIQALLSGQALVNQEIMLSRNSDIPIWVSVNTRSIELQGETVICSAMLDITEAKELSNQLTYHATYDDLTGLVNRREFEDRLQEVIDLARKRRSQNALCYLDLDQFKIINDTCGHMAGDELLRQIAPVLYDSVRREDTVARLGGDEFAILLEHCSLEDAERVARKVRHSIQEFRFVWQGKTFNVSVSIGLVPIAPDAETISDVLRRADTACYAAKDAGRNRIHVFRFDDQELAQRHGEMQWVSRISSALDNDRLELWAQKIVPAVRRDIHPAGHFELLVRMREEDGSLVMPGAFLPAAERYDLISRIDRWVMNATFDWLGQDKVQLQSLSCCAINISGQTLSDTEFLGEVTRRLSQSGVAPEKICFEITETAAIANLANATQFMRSLKNLGCVFALDDFGSGLSSFAYLKNLPVDYVKIDGFFVKDVCADPIDRAMVKAINDMAHAMGKLTIAEFVEDEKILQILIDLGVDYVQGYGIARPAPL